MSKRGRELGEIQKKCCSICMSVCVLEFRSAFLAIIDFVNLFLNSQFFSHTNLCSTQFKPESTWFYINMWYDVQISKWNKNNNETTRIQSKLITLKYKQNAVQLAQKTKSYHMKVAVQTMWTLFFFPCLIFQCIGTSSAFCQCNGNNVYHVQCCLPYTVGIGSMHTRIRIVRSVR